MLPRIARRVVQLDRALGADVPVDLAVDDDGAAGDLGVDLRALADDQHVVRHDGAGELAVDADGPLEGELALELGPAAEQGVEVAGGGGDGGQLIALQHGHGSRLLVR